MDESNEEKTEPGCQLLSRLGVRGKPVAQWSAMVTTAIGTFGEQSVLGRLTSHGAGPGAIVKTRLPGLAKELQARAAAKSSAGGASAGLPEVCGQCSAKPGDGLAARQVATPSGVARCPRCHPDAQSTVLTSVAGGGHREEPGGARPLLSSITTTRPVSDVNAPTALHERRAQLAARLAEREADAFPARGVIADLHAEVAALDDRIAGAALDVEVERDRAMA